MKGAINLRGIVVPIIDMRKRFNLEGEEYTATTVVIVISVGEGELERLIGIVVDAVSDVLDVEVGSINPTPDFGTKVNTEYIKGLVTIDEKMVMLLDSEKIFSTTEHSDFNAISCNESHEEKGEQQ